MDWEEPSGWPADAARDRLIGDWYIYQRKGGHRTSTDDLITAWYAIHRNPTRPLRYLDLGCGVGSVLLMVSHKVRPAHALGVEAQAQSAAMARRAIGELPDHGVDLQLHHSDFRAFDFSGEPFDLVTGSPPYFPLHTGSLPDDAQRRACRFEARGGVEVYLETAAKAMSRDALFYLVFQTRSKDRVVEAATRSGLHLGGQADFFMRRDRAEPFLSVFEFSHHPSSSPHRFSCPVRDGDGKISAEYQKIRMELGVEQYEAEGGHPGRPNGASALVDVSPFTDVT
jgi:tRNA1(Val) A37 N6-methylase TrmN6